MGRNMLVVLARPFDNRYRTMYNTKHRAVDSRKRLPNVTLLVMLLRSFYPHSFTILFKNSSLITLVLPSDQSGQFLEIK